MIDKYQPNFAALSQESAALLAGALLRRNPDFGSVEPDRLFSRCVELGMDHADVVMSLASDPSPLAVRTLETLVGKPLDVGWPCLKGPAPAKEPKSGEAPARAPREKVQRAPRGALRDPRIVISVRPNPKKPGSASYDRYELYRVGMTVDEAIAAGVKREDVAWDSDPKRGFIVLEMPK